MYLVTSVEYNEFKSISACLRKLFAMKQFEIGSIISLPLMDL